MIILAFDSSVNACSVSIWQDGKDVFSETKEMFTGQAEALLPMVADVLDKAKIKPQEINAVAVTSGPGSFTGIRIGLSAANALGFALNVPVIGVSTMEALVYSLPEMLDNQPLGVVIDTKRNDFYFQLFDNKRQAVSEIFYYKAEEICGFLEKMNLTEVNLVGDGVGRFLAEANSNKRITFNEFYKTNYPLSIKIASIASNELTKITPKRQTAIVKPLYLRPPDVSMPK
ncbi:MAG: tRNA (adenosine(37)-N6)-threonylcarbamoyltransferase complex dimerization subunit type 1 TsaB [Alphaproteobacteria bacterium]